MRTQDEIVARVDSIIKSDFGMFESGPLIDYLDYDHAKKYLKDDVGEDDYKQEQRTPKEVMIDYMPFAWRKANDQRGISAWRSLAHYKAWLWLDGDEDLWPTLDDYNFYGKPQLIEICKYLGIDHEEWDDGIRTN